MLGDIQRTVWRRSDIVGALAAYIYTTTATGGAVDMVAIKALCLTFGIDISEVAARVRTVGGAS